MGYSCRMKLSPPDDHLPESFFNTLYAEGAGVVVDMTLQHPEESGAILLRYGHLQPYQVWVRTQTCTQTIDCPDYQDDDSGSVSVSCPGELVQVDGSSATRIGSIL